ncbi:MAG TPA: hypothetical protein VED46_03025 [Alphaproteobacteria bacterium]|nr:hypothetical protein [Alphaproteobacteria bacterium]
MFARPLVAASFAILAALDLAAHAAEESSPFNERIGWFDKCLAIKNPALEPGTPVTFMIFDPDRTEFVAYGTFAYRVTGRIIGKTRSAERCPALNAVYGGINDRPDISFYEVSLVRDFVWAPESTEAVGILGLEAGAEMIDLNGDGVKDSFTLCHSGDGLRFEMWAGEARNSERLWSGDFHFGYNVSSGNCETGPNFVPEPAPFDPQVGYVDECLAIRNDTLEPGTPVTILTFEGDEILLARRILSLRLTGTILGKTTSDENCPPLAEIRKGIDESEGVSFYAVALDDGPFMNPDDAVFGIGILGLAPEDTNPIDLDGNGLADSFTSCTSLEEVNFAVWKDEPHIGQPLWEDYHYLGYEVAEPDCPGLEPDLSGPPSGWMPIHRIGWLHGCLGIFNTQLQPGTPIAIMTFAPKDEESQGRSILGNRITGRIVAKTDSGENCPPLTKDVRDWNVRWDIAYYTVALEGGDRIGADTLGIVGVHAEPGEAPFDLDGNGEADGFSVCDGKYGLTFVAWIGEAYGSTLLWSESVQRSQKPSGVRRCPRDL